ncbi:MAG TPA: LysR substrate-binding domain-containing protein [Rhodopila sp.]|nr:LysR substrate-binding domain-containing protein [Rhodopila sp.]
MPPLPLLALRAVAEIARLGSAGAAAEMMGVTPGAISQHIRGLEERLGVTLFDRTPGGMRLTREAASFGPRLALAFGEIEAVLREIEELRRGPALVVSTVASFAASWLVPRLPGFAARHPDVEVRIEASSTLVDLARDRVDVALRHGLGNYPGLEVTPLIAPVLLPVASPGLLMRGPPVRQPEDCLRHTLLQDADRADWRLWLRAHTGRDNPRAAQGPSFSDDYLMVRAAVAGLGLALVRDTYAAEEEAAGRLAVVLDLPWPTAFGYYAVTLPGARQKPHVAAFLAWLTDEASRSGKEACP